MIKILSLVKQKSMCDDNDEELNFYSDIIDVIHELINPKIKQDNPTCLLITDYPK